MRVGAVDRVDLLPPEITRYLTVSRQILYWFESTGHEAMPVWIWELQERKHGIYGFPPLGGLILGPCRASDGVKLLVCQAAHPELSIC